MVHLRTHRLLWQSRLLVITIPPLCATIVAASAAEMWVSTSTALAIGLAIALAAWRLRAATPRAAFTGGILTAAMLLAVNVRSGPLGDLRWFHSPLMPLMALLLLTLAATRFRGQEKARLGVGQDRRGRSAAQVVANLGIPALAGAIPPAISLLWVPNGRISPLLLSTASTVMLIAALAEATADTLSSELGEVLGGRPFLMTTWRRVPAGTDGAVSAAGTLAGGFGVIIIVLAAVPTMGLDWASAVAAGLGAMGGVLFDSLLGATLERRGWLNNDAVNFLSTLAAALFSLGLVRRFLS